MIIKQRRSYYGEDVEYFNGNKWVKLKDYSKVDKVLTYDDEDGSCYLTTPIKFFKIKCAYMNRLYYGNIFHLDVGDENVFYGLERSNLTPNEMTFNEIYQSNYYFFSNHFFLCTFKNNTNTCTMLDDTKFKIMIYAILWGEINEQTNICKMKVPNKELYNDIKRMLRNIIPIKSDNEKFIIELRLPRSIKTFIENPLILSPKELYTATDIFNHSVKGRALKPKYVDSMDFIQMVYALNGTRATIENTKKKGLHIKVWDSNMIRFDLSSFYMENISIIDKCGISVKTGLIPLRINGSKIIVLGDYRK